MICFFLSAPVLSGRSKASEDAPKSEAVSRSAFLGGPAEMPMSVERMNLQGGISAGGAKKAEQRRAQGAGRRLCRQAKQRHEEQGRKGRIDFLYQIELQQTGVARLTKCGQHHGWAALGIQTCECFVYWDIQGFLYGKESIRKHLIQNDFHAGGLSETVQ